MILLQMALLSPLLISVAGIIVISAATIAYHLIVVRCRLRRRRSGTGAIQGCQMAIGGVEQSILRALPILSYWKTERNSCQSECAICLVELENGDSVRLLPHCGHLFHVSCVDGWFLAHRSCPVCRSPVVAPICSATPSHGVIEDVRGTDCDDDGGVGDAAASEGVESDYHSVLIMLSNMEEVPRRFTALKRSFSMDRSLDLKSDLGDESRSLRMMLSMRRLDGMPSRLLRSFSQLRVTQASTANGILPY